MAIGLVGRKCGMTRIFTEEGSSIPVTVIEVLPNRVTQIKRPDKDGYCSYQVTLGQQKPSRLTKPLAGHYAKVKVEPGIGLWEFRLEDESQLRWQHPAGERAIEPGAEITVSLFKEGDHLDVVGTSKGKGFAGTVKRHNFRTQDATHGNSLSHRVPGSIGQNQTPGRVFKGKKMAGQMGNRRTTVQNLELIRVDAERNLLLIKGAIPGAASGKLVLTPSVKAREVKE